MTTVIGAGLGGLSAAYYLLRRFGEPIAIYEASNRVGGWIRTERYRDKGFLFEAGPHTIRVNNTEASANTLQLIEQLDLPVDAVTSNHAAVQNRMIYAKGQLCQLPNSIQGIFKTTQPFSKPLISALINDIRTDGKKVKHNDESIYNFAKRRFGSEVADYLVGPVICGICAGDAKEISVRFLLNEIFEKEQRWGGVLKGMILGKFFQSKRDSLDTEGIFAESSLYERARREKWRMYRVQGGLEWLPRALNTHLRQQNTTVQMSSECREIIFTRRGVRMNIKGREIDSKFVVGALPSYKLAACVKNQHPSLAGQLLSIPYVDVAVVNLQYSSEDVLQYNGFGVLVPPIERLPILGVIFDSCCFDMQGNTVLTVMMGGRWFEENFGKNPSQKEILDTALQQVERILGINHEPRITRVHILQKCIPQYTVGHKRRVEDIRRYISQYDLPLMLVGSAYDGVGINDIILSARKQVDRLVVMPEE